MALARISPMIVFWTASRSMNWRSGLRRGSASSRLASFRVIKRTSELMGRFEGGISRPILTAASGPGATDFSRPCNGKTECRAAPSASPTRPWPGAGPYCTSGSAASRCDAADGAIPDPDPSNRGFEHPPRKRGTPGPRGLCLERAPWPGRRIGSAGSDGGAAVAGRVPGPARFRPGKASKNTIVKSALFEFYLSRRVARFCVRGWLPDLVPGLINRQRCL